MGFRLLPSHWLINHAGLPGSRTGGVTGAASPDGGGAVDEDEPPPEAIAGFTPEQGPGFGIVTGEPAPILTPSFARFTPDTGEGSILGGTPKVPIPPVEGELADDEAAGEDDASAAVLGFFVADMVATRVKMVLLQTAAEIAFLVSDRVWFPDSGSLATLEALMAL